MQERAIDPLTLKQAMALKLGPTDLKDIRGSFSLLRTLPIKFINLRLGLRFCFG